MKDIIQINRFSEKLMNIVSVVSQLHEITKTLATSLTQDNLDKLTKLANDYQVASEEMQNCCITFLNEITAEDAEEIEVDASETDMGYKL